MRTVSIRLNTTNKHQSFEQVPNGNWVRPYRNLTIETTNFDRFLIDDHTKAFFRNFEQITFKNCKFRNSYVIFKVLMCCPKIKRLQITAPTIKNQRTADRENILNMTCCPTLECCEFEVEEDVVKFEALLHVFVQHFINMQKLSLIYVKNVYEYRADFIRIENNDE
jgi:hypothetical protein